MEGPSLLALVPVAAALRVFPEPRRLRADETLVVVAVLVIGVAHRSVATVDGETIIADEGSLVEAFLIAVRRI